MGVLQLKKNYLFLTFILLFVLTACSKNVNHQKVEDDAVKIWWYEEAGVGDGETTYNYVMNKAIEKLKFDAELNDIKMEVNKYSYKDLSYEDYVLKRNAAITYGDVNIIFDKVDNLYQLRDKAGSYEKIEKYEKIFDNFKKQYCIPVFTDMHVNFVNNDVLKKYNIEIKNVITLNEYYKIKQNMKKAGARFKLNDKELWELIDYYTMKNNAEVFTKDGKLDVNKETVKNTILEVVDDLNNYYDYSLNDIETGDTEYKIYEQTSGYEFSGLMYNYSALSYEEYDNNRPPIEKSTIVVMDDDYFKFNIPCIFIPENNKNVDAYKLANVLISDGFQISLYEEGFGVITNSQRVKELTGFDKNWNYVGVRYLTDADGNKVATKIYAKKEEDKLYELLTKGYEIIRSRDMSKFFMDSSYDDELSGVIYCEILNIIEKNNKFDNFNEDMDDFITNLNVMHN